MKCRAACLNAAVKSGLCLEHYKLKLAGWVARSQYRKMLGLCGQCLRPTESGITRCARCHASQVKSNDARTAAAAKARGWKLAKVPA